LKTRAEGSSEIARHVIGGVGGSKRLRKRLGPQAREQPGIVQIRDSNGYIVHR
jgi:hypothetical protein